MGKGEGVGNSCGILWPASHIPHLIFHAGRKVLILPGALQGKPDQRSGDFSQGEGTSVLGEYYYTE